MKKLYRIEYDDNIRQIKTNKPFYYNKTKNLIVVFNIPNCLSDVSGLSKLVTENMYGFMVKVKSSSQYYNFTDKNNNNIKIRGWKLKMKSINVLKIE